MFTLFDLPVELVLGVLSYVDPIDLLMFNQVCKSARGIISERTVWESSIRRIFRESSLFESSFPPLRSMNLDGLKRTALRPHKLGRIIEDRASTTLRRHPELLLKCNVDYRRRRDFIRVQIVPGGRYVLGLADTYICLWDIGSPSSKKEEPILLDIAHCDASFGPYGQYQTMTLPSLQSGNSFRFAVHSHDGQELSQRIQVYEVGPFPNCTRLRQLSELCLDGDAFLSHFWVSGDRAYIHRYQNLFAVWDFVSSCIISWNLVKVKRPCEMYNIEDVLILLQEEGLHAWRFPPLQSMEGHFTLSEAPLKALNPPMYRWQDQSDTSNPHVPRNPTRWFVPSKWMTFKPDTPVMITTLTPTPHRTFQIRALTIEVSRANAAVQVVDRLLSESPEVESLYRRIPFSPRAYSACGRDCYVISPADESNLRLLIHHSTFHPEDRKIWDKASCILDHGVDTVTSMVCPHSGRLAYTCQGGHGDGYNRIHIVDLLGP